MCSNCGGDYENPETAVKELEADFREKWREQWERGTRLVCLVATREVIHLEVSPQFIGFQAVDGNTFDADWDGEKYVTTCPMGNGETDAEAIEDLLEQLTEAAHVHV